MNMKKVKNHFRSLFLEHQKRADRLISKTEAAKALGMSRTTLDNWLEDDIGRFDAGLLVRVCDYLQVPLSELLEYVPDGWNHPRS